MNITEIARQMVVVQLDQAVANGTLLTTDMLRDLVTSTAGFVISQHSGESIDIEQLIRDIEADYNVYVGSWNSLSDDTDHVAWLEERIQHKKDWRYWDRYARHLKQSQGLPSPAIKRLDEVTDNILGRLENPQREGAWDRRGLVAGQVQSGKTANYTGLIAKALDNGYKFVVVLAGIHNSLRSQTQARIDEGILGFDTRNSLIANQADESSRIGVGLLAGPPLYVSSFTSSANTGDFRLNVAKNMGVKVGGSDPIVVVVKKNKSILQNLFKWATGLTKERDPETGEYIVRGVPMLVIDDEADHASVNTKGSGTVDEETDPSVINGLIRKFLKTFDQTAYVAYTATPFANIFIDPDANHSNSGEDLFPRSFIVNLPAPSNYTGPEQVFGLKEDVANAIDEIEALPIVRTVADYDTWLPDKHKAGDRLGKGLPQTLQDAIVFFLMAGAVRRLRGQDKKHHSMLVHVTRFIDMQRQVAEQVEDFLKDSRNRLVYGEGDDPRLAAQVARIYSEDLAPTTADMEHLPDLDTLVGELPSLEEIWRELPSVADNTRIHVVNGSSKDALEYVDHPDGISVIAIGGNKLSRGLTLEGLCVSYYLRASKMYDTLMQMGRWFGYRPGYLDLCRLFTTSSLVGWYKRITAASTELQREFEAMAAVNRTPMDFGLRVRQHPDGLLVTSPSKLRNAQKIKLSFSGSSAETVTFRAGDRATNLAAADALITSLGDEEESLHSGLHVWRNATPEDVLSFLSDYQTDRAAFKTQPKALSDYIRARVNDGELENWTIALADVAGNTPWRLGGKRIGLTQRASHGDTSDPKRYTIRRIVSPTHELLELDKGSAAWDHALEETIKSWALKPNRKADDKQPERPSGLWERKSRDVSRGLLLIYPLTPEKWDGHDDDPTPFIGFAVSFPESKRAEPIEYQVNSITLREEFGWDDEDFDDQLV